MSWTSDHTAQFKIGLELLLDGVCSASGGRREP